ncbi:response regulator transcription factor [Blastococcus brunescens]|uniref:Response regulator transcription factor n=1 Tax=Blastococcus brunescens TaxID=1564165 RepID=A0ABZ1B4V3_9ACTN|nr:response regulator transcription factor [Blastococcus sp. BMG 8361]WRL65827.1 response regulator transcription factor [Blastococcus sp. BMG 8361]
MNPPLRIVVADDHPMFREGLRFVLGREEDLVVVGEAATGAEALRLTRELDPDVVVMDLAMPDVGGLAATRRLTELGARARILVLTMSEDDESVLAALRAAPAATW